ncbi:MAG: ATP-binding protein [Chloroflexi bacterium]|nr:ATP-binding protein [Chloroflexota bacterium]
MFVDREQDLADLNDILSWPGAQLILISGRRRVGKTTLLIEWARRSGYPLVYWVASRSSAGVLLQDFSQALWRHTHPNDVMPTSFSYDIWTEACRQVTALAANQRLIVILDEFAYAADADPSLPSLLQNAWDHHLKQSQVCLVLSGSHISLMNELQTHAAPLYGRFTAQLRVDPLPFRALKEFLPRYDTEKRVAVYAILGGIPAYLEHFSDRHTLRENLERTVMRRTGMFRNEPPVLIGDLVREPRYYAAILRAIAAGRHTPDEIEKAGTVPPGNVGKYLSKLVELYLVERRLPATVPREQRTTQSRYYLRDPFLRFYYRFLEPNQDLLELSLTDALWSLINEQLRAFIGATAFEELCREWTLVQGRTGKLPFVPQTIGGHWSPTVQVDVAAVSWREKAILLGECKWGTGPVSRQVVSELIEDKTPLVLAALPDGKTGWRVYHALFARAGFTEAATALAREHGIMLVDLEQLGRELEG